MSEDKNWKIEFSDPSKYVAYAPPQRWLEIRTEPQGYWKTLPHKGAWKPNWFRRFCMWALFDMVWDSLPPYTGPEHIRAPDQ